MHRDSIRAMRDFRNRYVKHGMSIIDVGSQIVDTQTESYRNLFPPEKYNYIGMDIVAGRNVDIVGFENIVKKYDILISGQTMEHVKRPWEWLKSLDSYWTRLICIVAPHTWKEHRYPIDTYRYMPDGMRDLFEYAGIEPIEIIKRECDTIGIGRHNGY